MKACFLLQRRFAYVGNKLAVILKEKYGLRDFCGLVYLRSSFDFLTKQPDIKYTALLLDEDIHNRFHDEPLDPAYLKNLEKEYGLPSLWPYLALDRVLMFNLLKREYPCNTPLYTHEEMMRILQVEAKAIIKFLEEEKPDFIFMTVVGRVGTMLLYQIAKKKGIPVFIGVETRIGDDYILTDNYKNFSWAEKKFQSLMAAGRKSEKLREAKEYLENFRKKPTTYLYFINNSELKTSSLKELKWFLPKNLLRSLAWFLKLTYRYFAKKKWLDYTEENPISFAVDKIKRKIRLLIGHNRFYDAVDLTEDFAYYPLHYEPEIATLLLAPFWTDQLNLIRQIAKSLPLHFKLYVKEHPAMVRFRPFSYYRELKKIPNVKLADPNFPSFDLVKNSKMIITLTGTAGWEGVLFKKPVITFGDVFYNALSTVKKCLNIEQLPFLIDDQLKNHQPNEEELETFIGAIMEESAPVGLLEIWEKGIAPEQEKKRLTLFADLLAKKLNLKPLV